jgi:hypothetical protein
LHGWLCLTDVDDEDIAALQACSTTTEGNGHCQPDDIRRYRALAVRVRDILFDPLDAVLQIIRLRFGQHWVPALPRTVRLTGAPDRFFLLFIPFSWSADEGETELEFDVPLPEPHRWQNRDSDSDLLQFMSRDDWDELARSAARWNQHDGFVADYAFESFTRARRLRDEGDLRHAYVEAVTALEVALNAYRRRTDQPVLKRDDGNDPSLGDNLRSLLEADDRLARFAAQLDQARGAIDRRNDIVHEGKTVAPYAVEELDALLDVVRGLLDPPPKVPSAATALLRSSAWLTFLEPACECVCPICGHRWM